MSVPAEPRPELGGLAALFDGPWRSAPTTQRMFDGTVLATWGVHANGVWIGCAHPIGPSPAEQVIARRHAAMFAASKGMAEALQAAVVAFGAEFDAGEDVPGAELVQWFAQWRETAKAALGRAGAA